MSARYKTSDKVASMIVYKCDVCKKNIKNKDTIVFAGIGHLSSSLCMDCGEPVKKFLKKNKLLEKTKKN